MGSDKHDTTRHTDTADAPNPTVESRGDMSSDGHEDASSWADEIKASAAREDTSYKRHGRTRAEMPDPADADVEMPHFRTFTPSKILDVEQVINDYEDLEQVNSALLTVTKSLFRVNDMISEYERKHRAAKTEYERRYNRVMLHATGKTVRIREADATIMCESYENSVKVLEQMISELTREAWSLRTTLNMLEIYSNNMRQQMKIV